jgi:PII-like signaling protein
MTSADCLKLTTYVGERTRADDRFVVDTLLDLYGTAGISTSILLRGTEGFGRKHRLRTDQTLTMSEDLPVMTVATDTSERITALLDDVLAINRSGLLTLERSMLAHGRIELPEQLHEETKLTVFVGRQEKVRRTPTFVAICDLLHRNGVAGASVVLGVDGTVHGRRQRAHFFDRNADVPVMITAVGSGERIGAAMPELETLLPRPLISVERVRVCKRDGQLHERPHVLPANDFRGMPLWQKMTIYSSESTMHHGRPIHRAILRRLRESTAVRGATAVRGIWGFHGDHAPHGDRLLQWGRHVPVTTVVVDTPDNITAAFDIVDEITSEHGLVTTEMVPALGDTDGGELRLAQHDY